MSYIKERKFRLIIVGLFTLSTLTTSYIYYQKYTYNKYYIKQLSSSGQDLLNEYEFPWYLAEEMEDENYCLRPYDVNDGVITFGPGITFPTEQEGLDIINSKYQTNYTIDNNCITTEILFKLQQEILQTYEEDVYNHLFKYHVRLKQNEFDALVILDYNSPDFIEQDEVIKVLKKDLTKEDYVMAIDNYYQQIDSYFDNPNTEQKDDGFGQGWYNRIVDSAEVFYDNEYEFQNNAVY